jgi:hypothetical protein
MLVVPGVSFTEDHLFFFFVCSLHSLCSHSCVAAISTVIISGDWEGSLLFHDMETKTNVVSVEKAHPGGVTAVTVFSSNDDEGLFAGSTHKHARARFP